MIAVASPSRPHLPSPNSPSYRYPPRHSPQVLASPSSPDRGRLQTTPPASAQASSSSQDSQLIYLSRPRHHHLYPQAHHTIEDDEPAMIYSTPNRPISSSSSSSSAFTGTGPPSPSLPIATRSAPALPSLSKGYTSVSPISYDGRGRQQGYVENPAQRHERVEFLRRRENLRRVRAWVEELSESGLAEVEHVEDVDVRASDAAGRGSAQRPPVRPQSRAPAHAHQVIYHTAPAPLAPPGWAADSFAEEPYVFYTSPNHPSSPSLSPACYRSPSPSSASASSSARSMSMSSSPPTSVGSSSPSRSPERDHCAGKGSGGQGKGAKRERRRSGALGRHSRQSSLESISEEGEGE